MPNNPALLLFAFGASYSISCLFSILILSSQGFCISPYISLSLLFPTAAVQLQKSSDCSTTMALVYSLAPEASGSYNTDLGRFLRENKRYADVTFASFVFYPPKSDIITDRGLGSNAPGNVPFEPARLLLLQRNLTDASFPNLWEVPWGACTLMDATILHSAKRTIFERTGLHIERLVKEIGKAVEYRIGDEFHLRISFEIEIAEMVTSEFGIYGDDIPLKIDPHEHQGSAWVTEKDILDRVYPLVEHQNNDVTLKAFRLRRRAEKQVRAQAIMASRARKRKRHEISSGSEGTDGAGSGKDDDGEEEDEEIEEDEEESEEEDEEEGEEEDEEVRAEEEAEEWDEADEEESEEADEEESEEEDEEEEEIEAEDNEAKE